MPTIAIGTSVALALASVVCEISRYEIVDAHPPSLVNRRLVDGQRPIFRRLSDSVVVMNQGHQPPLPTVEITLIIPPCSKLLPQCARMEFWLLTSVYN
jgi:hypothetical protein